MRERRVHLSPRLEIACELLSGAHAVADIGCDHGRLSAGLLQSQTCKRVIASDISEASLSKARMLAAVIGLDTIDFRVGDGLTVLSPGECDAVCMLGMGGTLMARLLDAVDVRALGVTRLVLQPMRAFADIRRYLHENNYYITDDRIVHDSGRWYQIFAAVPAESIQPVPDSWPTAFFDLGFVSLQQRDRNLAVLAQTMLLETHRRLSTAEGSEGESKLRQKEQALQIIIRETEKMG